MLRRFLGLFDPSGCADARTLLDLIVSDYLAYYGAWPGPGYKILTGSERPDRAESQLRLALLFVPRVLHNPCLHATVLLRLVMASPRFTIGLWRTILIAKHSIDVSGDMRIGPGLVLPHPLGILLGWGMRVGSRATILNNVSIGSDLRQPPDAPRLSPAIGDDVAIFAHSLVFGPITIGDGAVIRARAWVNADVAPGEVVSGR